MTHHSENIRPRRPYRTTAVVAWIVLALVGVLVFVQFRGGFTPTKPLTLFSDRAGLLVGTGSRVTLNGIEIGKVEAIDEVERDGRPAAKFTLQVAPRYLPMIPDNVDAAIKATTLFGGKYVALAIPSEPSAPIGENGVIDSQSVSMEINTVFETLTSVAQSVDPVKLNLTLSGAADALSGLGQQFGDSLVNANQVLDNINPQMDQVQHNFQQFATLTDAVGDVSPELWNALKNVSTTARTLNEQQNDLDATLLAAIGFAESGSSLIEESRPHLVQTLAQLTPVSDLLDTYSPELHCAIRNAAEVAPKVAAAQGEGNGYSTRVHTQLVGGTNPYVFPDNLPRVKARGGPGGAPGCWQEITRELWPAPALITDTGASIAPYNHFEIGSPWANEYIWGRQVGEYTINP